MIRTWMRDEYIRGDSRSSIRCEDIVETEARIGQSPPSKRGVRYWHPGVLALCRVKTAPAVRQAQGDDGCECFALSRSVIRRAGIERSLVAVDVGSRDVQVAAYHHGLAGRQKAPDEGEEDRIEAMAVRLPVRPVQERRAVRRHCPQGGQLDCEDATFTVDIRHAGGPHADRGVLAQDGNAVVAATFGATPRSVIPAYHAGQGLAPQLRLLKAQDIGLPAQQRLQAPVLHAGGASVHVPGDDPHAGKGRTLPENDQIKTSKNRTTRRRGRPGGPGPPVGVPAYPLPFGTLSTRRVGAYTRTVVR